MNASNQHAPEAKKSIGPAAIAGMALLAAIAFFLSRGVGIGAELTVVDGEVQVYAGERWMEAKEGDPVKEGTKLRTGEGKAVIVFDEGSALRLDAGTEIEVVSADRTQVRVRNLDGRVYSRVDATAGLAWTVEAQGAEVTALGTAFAVGNDKDGKKVAVDVIKSKVKVKITKDDGSIEKEASEGIYLAIDFNKPVNEAMAEVEIDREDAKKDPFLAWNFALDAELEAAVDARVDAETEPDDASVTETKEVEAAPEEKPVTTTTTVKTTTTTTTKTAVPAIKLAGKADATGVHLTWSLVNGASAKNGFKVVKGLTVNPTYPGSDATFVDASARAFDLKLLDGKAWHFRVCAYDGAGGCTLYSNDLALTALTTLTPNEKSAFIPIGSELQLVAVRDIHGIVLDWSARTSSGFQGYKVVRSQTNPNLFYPQDGYIKYFTDRSATHLYDEGAKEGKTYYYRICAIEKDGSVYCGNAVKVQ